eukprot:GHVR01068533.1.p1 GENE.GHVR01068533.1~~GHVR01068533.1.p1  ORF type:complete len:280 (+),score=37.66 GHVR01068533.1:125-841(+)
MYTLTERIGNDAFFAETDDKKTKVAVKVYDNERDMISNYMKPDGIQISEVLYDSYCNRMIKEDPSYEYYELIPYIDAKCLITKCYIYNNKINNLEQYIDEYNKSHDYKNSSLDLVFDRVFVQILTGLNYLHDPLSRKDTDSKSVIHMDLKPANIFISNNSETGEIECRLGDFEYAECVFGTECYEPRGSPRYYDHDGRIYIFFIGRLKMVYLNFIKKIGYYFLENIYMAEDPFSFDST